MKAPSPPPTPDPYETAAAQQMANVEVAIANTFLKNADEYRPDGQVNYEPSGKTVTTNTYDADGNITGTRVVDGVKKVVSLTTQGQTIYDIQQSVILALNQWALDQTNIMQDLQSDTLDEGDLTPRLDNPDAVIIDTTEPTVETLTDSIGAADLTTHLSDVRSDMMDRLNADIIIDTDYLESKLANQGLVPGMTAYDRAMDLITRQSTDTRIRVDLEARQEQSRLVGLEEGVASFRNRYVAQKLDQDMKVIDFRNSRRVAQFQSLVAACEYVNGVRHAELQETIGIKSHNFNEIIGLLHGGQIQVPKFQAYQSGAIAKTPVAESVYQSAALDMQKWQTKVQSQSQMTGGILGFAGNMMGGMMALSDRRLKTDIHLVEYDERGFGWYSYRYLWSAQKYIGVMAQEVKKILPGSVVTLPSGVMAVDYGALT